MFQISFRKSEESKHQHGVFRCKVIVLYRLYEVLLYDLPPYCQQTNCIYSSHIDWQHICKLIIVTRVTKSTANCTLYFWEQYFREKLGISQVHMLFGWWKCTAFSLFPHPFDSHAPLSALLNKLSSDLEANYD